MNIKQVIVLRKDLNMRKGKMVAQGAHASMKVFFDRMKQVSYSNGGGGNFVVSATSEMASWMNGGFTKICVGVDSEQELIEVYNKARAKGIPCSIITDSGRTEFDGVPTKTAVAIGPDSAATIDEITGKLTLL